MFGAKHKIRAAQLEEQKAIAERELASARTELEQARRASVTAEAQLREFQGELEKCAQIYRTMQSFGESFSEIQRSQLAIANSMKNERQHAIEASTVSGTNRAAMEKIASNLLVMSADTSEMAVKVENLSQRTSQIGGIVQLIKEIADQTNLLALNAAIEAARAGEQGRGFAVVADEVRKLAERTTNATSEISTMIGAIQSEISSAVTTMGKGGEQAEEGVAMAHQADEAIDQITASVKRVVEMIQQIAHSTREESEITSTVASRIDHIAQMASESSETIGQTAQACHGIQAMTHALQDEVARFRL